MQYSYDPELAAFVDLIPALDISDVPKARDQVAAMRDLLPTVEISESIEVADRLIPIQRGAPDVRVQTVAPKNASKPTPALLWFHGGGFVMGTAEQDLAQSVLLAKTLGVSTISVDYSLAPEHPYPAAVLEGYAALHWVASNSMAIGVDATKLAVGGQSAGGCLAASVTLMARDRRGPDICLQLLDAPVTDDSLSTRSVSAFTDTPLWNSANATLSWEMYLGDRANGDTPSYAAPSRAGDLSGLPSAFVVVCEFDPLRDEGIAYGRRLERAGVPTEVNFYPGTFHGSSSVIPGAAISERMTSDVVAALERAFAGSPR